MSSITLKGSRTVKVLAPLWTTQQPYSVRVDSIGEHDTFYMDYNGFSVEVFVPVGLDYFDAKQSAQSTFKRIFGRYPERSDIYSSPEESRESEWLPCALGPVLGYVAMEAIQ